MSDDVCSGDLRFACGSGAVRLVWVWRVDGDVAVVMLVHTAIELACGTDFVVPAAVSGAPYAVVVESDLQGVVWVSQVGDLVGRVEPGLIGREEAESGVCRGLDLAGPADPRWAFKGEEGVEFRRLTGPARAWLFGLAP